MNLHPLPPIAFPKPKTAYYQTIKRAVRAREKTVETLLTLIEYNASSKELDDGLSFQGYLCRKAMPGKSVNCVIKQAAVSSMIIQVSDLDRINAWLRETYALKKST